jgi:hypothetical protein
LAALLAVLASGAVVAASASAFHPLFLNGNGAAELLFSGEGGLFRLRALNLGVLGTIDCEKSLVHGFTLNKSTLARKVLFTFEGKCLKTVGSIVGKCTEPIKTVNTSVELGLASSTLHKVLELVAPESGTEFWTEECEANNTTYEGAFVGEIPETNTADEAQLNVQRSSSETVFEAQGKSTDQQKYTSLELLGSLMTGVELKAQGFFGGKVSFEFGVTTKPLANGTVEISTK